MKIKSNYVEFSIGEFMSLMYNFVKIYQTIPEDDNYVVRLNEDNVFEMGYPSDIEWRIK